MSTASDILKKLNRKQSVDNYWKNYKGNPDSEYAKVLRKQEQYTPYPYVEDEQSKFEWIISECQEEAERRIPRHLYREDWYDFSRKFVAELDGSKVNSTTGMSNIEYKDYLIDSYNVFGYPRPDPNEKTTSNKLKKFFESLGPDHANNNYEKLFE